jgi:hypothetical protein
MPAGIHPATRFMTAKTTKRSYFLAPYCLAAAVIGAAVFGMTPGLREVVEYVRFSDAPGAIFVARWALWLLLIGAIQIAYGVYLIPLPDWASIRVVAVMLASMAGLYAMVLALLLTASPTGWLLGPSGLQLSDHVADGKAALWCLCLVSLTMTIAFFAGRMSSQLQRAERLRLGLPR